MTWFIGTHSARLINFRHVSEVRAEGYGGTACKKVDIYFSGQEGYSTLEGEEAYRFMEELRMHATAENRKAEKERRYRVMSDVQN